MIQSIQPANAQDGWLEEAFSNDKPQPSRQTNDPTPDRGNVSTSGNAGYLPPMTAPPSAPYGNPGNAAPLPDDNAAYGETAPYGRQPAGTRPPQSAAVIREDLSPVLANDGSGLPHELWNGLDEQTTERLLAKITIPPRSPATHDLWRRLMTASVPPPVGTQGQQAPRFSALRLEALYRSGLLDDLSKELGQSSGGDADPVMASLKARTNLALGNEQAACDQASQMARSISRLPQRLKAETILLVGYCALDTGSTEAAELTAAMARENGLDERSAPGLAALETAGRKTKPSLKGATGLSLVDALLLRKVNAFPADKLPAATSPALLVSIAQSTSGNAAQRLFAAERAAALNAISASQLAGIYRDAGTRQSADSIPDGPERRAALFNAADQERTPFKAVRVIRAFLDSARRADLYLPALRLMSEPAARLQPIPEIGWFAETAIEIALTAGDTARARDWVDLADRSPAGETSLRHWLALADIISPGANNERGAILQSVESMALTGRFGSEQLHKLATVLDALEYNVPIPLWEAASRTPQPTTGHLPETGVLSDLRKASKSKQFGHTVLLTMQTLGKGGPAGAHMIALGDSIRALKRAGLEKEARLIAFEALFPAWPRRTTG